MKIENGVLINVSISDIPEDGRLIIPGGVTSIGEYAFYCYSRLTSVVIPDSVTSIEDYAFFCCYCLTSIAIPNSVTKIGRCMFYKCHGVTSVSVADGNPAYHSANNCIIETASKTLIIGCRTSVIPTDGSVTSIGECAFDNCDGLTGSFVIPDGVTSIGNHAFSCCTCLTEVTIPDSIMDIGYAAFYGCRGLKTITIGSGVTNISGQTFHGTPLKSANKNYKAFWLCSDGSLVCIKKKYRLGKRSFVKGGLRICENGIHYCTNLFEIFDYYGGEYDKDFVIAECEVSKEQKGERDSSKRCARWIIPQRILAREEVIQILNEGGEKK